MQRSEAIKLPSKLDLQCSIEFAKRLNETVPAESFSFDFKNVRWVEPFGLLRTACSIRDFTATFSHCSRFKCRIPQSQDTRALNYAAYMGFFQACRFDYGNPTGGKPGYTYLPITFKDTRELVTDQRDFGSQIKAIATNLTAQLIRPYSKQLFRPVEFSFKEIIRNVVEHSESDEIGYCAQYWPKKDIVEIAIVDTGIGLRCSLEENPHLDISSDSDALKCAVLPGVSGKVYEGVTIDPNDEWQNSGFGLYMNYRLCNEAGEFFICSGQKGLYRTIGAADNQYFDTNFQGTILRLRLNPSELHNHQELLDRIRNEGEEFARKYGNGANLTASKISGYLRKNFQNLHGDISIGAQVQHLHFGVGRVEDLIPARSEYLALVTFSRSRSRSRRVPISELVPYDGPPSVPYGVDDIPF